MKDCARIVLVYEIRMSACNLGVRVGRTTVNIGIILSGEPSRRLVVFWFMILLIFLPHFLLLV